MTDTSSNCWQLLGDGPEAYERYIVPAFSGIWAQDMVKRAQIDKGDRILDLACGTGIVTRHALSLLDDSCQITGIDLNAAVLEKAREICSPESEPVTWQQCDAMFQTILESISDYIDDYGLAAPMESYVVTGLK